MEPSEFFRARHGTIFHGDSLRLMANSLEPESVDLIMTSPPFGLVRKKDYGNVESEKYVAWFKEFGQQFTRVLKPHGSLVIDIGGAWMPNQPTRSLYQYELLIMLCKDLGFHLAQDFFWWNPAKLPTPAEWVTVRRVRCKDAVNTVWWLSRTPWPKASNRRVLAAYSASMNSLLKNGYNATKRPSGHDISDKFGVDNGGAIPPNLLAFPNTESNSCYLRYCEENGLKPHPARFPSALPEFFLRMLSDKGDTILDPFGGSCVTGEVAERLQRRWICCDLEEEYVKGARGRFQRKPALVETRGAKAGTYSVPNPLLNPTEPETPLPADGGQKRAFKKVATLADNGQKREGNKVPPRALIRHTEQIVLLEES